MKVEIYGAEWCKPCQNAKKVCVDKNLDYTFNDISVEPEALKKVSELLGYEPKTIPQIFIDGKHIGGSSEFIILMEKQANEPTEQTE